MPPNLEIRILFCYSPEVLQHTYGNNKKFLKIDNEELCRVTQDIFNSNISKYNVLVTATKHLRVDSLQVLAGQHNESLSTKQIGELAECTLASHNPLNRVLYGKLPDKLLTLKTKFKATVLVLQVLLNTVAYKYVGRAATIGVQENRDNTVVIARGTRAKNLPTTWLKSSILAHEFGHLMGCRHPQDLRNEVNNQPGFDNTSPNTNNHGDCIIDPYTGRIVTGTIMSYIEQPILYYSNPTIFKYPAPYQNIACGMRGLSEAYKTVNANIQKLAGFF